MLNLNEAILDASQDVVENSDKPLDYSPESLNIIEEILDELSDVIDVFPEEKVKSIITIFGCYILEVARRQFEGRYAWAETYAQPVFIVGEPHAKIAIITWDKVESRLKGDKADNIPFFYEGFVARAKKPEPGADVLFV
jgi:hypothetical protein